MAWQKSSRSPSEAFDKTNTVTISKDRREDKPDWASEYRGEVNIDGKEYWLNFRKVSDAQRDSGIMLSGKVVPKVDKRREDYKPVNKEYNALDEEPRRKSPPPVRRDTDFEDEIPF